MRRRQVAAAVAAVGVTETAAWVLGCPSAMDAAGTWVIDRGPLPLIEHTVALFKTVDKPVIRVSSGAAILGAGALAGNRDDRGARRAVLALGALAAVGALLMARRRATAVAPLSARGGVPAWPPRRGPVPLRRCWSRPRAWPPPLG